MYVVLRFNDWLRYVQSQEQILRALARVSSEVNEGNGRTAAAVQQQPKVICTLLIELDFTWEQESLSKFGVLF